jgi:hypothetical protein
VKLRIKELLGSGALTFGERIKPVSSRPSSEYDVMFAGKVESRIFAIERAWFCKFCPLNTASTRMERTVGNRWFQNRRPTAWERGRKRQDFEESEAG